MQTTTAEVGLSGISTRQWLILVMVPLTTLLFGMTITLVNVVLPQMRGTFAATQDQIAWVVTSNLVATAVATPMTGWLSDRLGWRNLLFGSVLGFTVSSLLCGLANSLETLVVYRIGQGLFGAPIMPMGQAVLLATFPRHLHAKVMMLWGAGSVIGPVFGPVLGSLISEAYSWRGAFFMIVPPGVAALIFVWLALAGSDRRKEAEFDWTGFVALAVALASAQLIMDRGQRLDWFESTEIIIEAVVAATSFWVFIVHSLTARRPFLDPGLLLDRNFAIGLTLSLIMGMLSFTPMVLFPILLHDLRGYPDSAVGLLLAARGLGNWCSFLIVVPFTQRNPRLAVACGLAAQAVAGLAMARLDINLTSFDVFWTNMLQGFGFGLAFTPMSVLAFATLPQGRMTEAAGIFHLVRSFGSSLFISASVVVLLRTAAQNYAGFTELLSPFNKVLAYPPVLGLWNTSTPSGLMVLAGELQRQAAMIGFINAFYMFAFAAAVAVPLAWLQHDVPRGR